MSPRQERQQFGGATQRKTSVLLREEGQDVARGEEGTRAIMGEMTTATLSGGTELKKLASLSRDSRKVLTSLNKKKDRGVGQPTNVAAEVFSLEGVTGSAGAERGATTEAFGEQRPCCFRISGKPETLVESARSRTGS